MIGSVVEVDSQNVAWTQLDVCPILVSVANTNLNNYSRREFIQELVTEGDVLYGIATTSYIEISSDYNMYSISFGNGRSLNLSHRICIRSNR